jgi:hypothetical protein
MQYNKFYRIDRIMWMGSHVLKEIKVKRKRPVWFWRHFKFICTHNYTDVCSRYGYSHSVGNEFPSIKIIYTEPTERSPLDYGRDGACCCVPLQPYVFQPIALFASEGHHVVFTTSIIMNRMTGRKYTEERWKEIITRGRYGRGQFMGLVFVGSVY